MIDKQTLEDHKKRHEQLHQALDELIADFIMQTGNYPSETRLKTLMVWSYEQTISPTTPKTMRE